MSEKTGSPRSGGRPSPGQVRDRIRNNFDRGAGAYRAFEQASGHFARLASDLVSLAPDLTGATVLDVGCGTGASAAVLRDAVGPGGRVVGIDISLGMLREARGRVAGCGFAVVDGCRFDRALNGPFDAVVYNAVLFMLPDAAASLDAARAVLGPSGVVLVANLDGVFVTGGRAVPDLLRERGLAAGRHALSPWDRVRSALDARFGRVDEVERTVHLGPSGFEAFYGLEPMSAGLLPRLPYPERVAVVRGLAREWAGSGVGVYQVWKLAVAGRRGPTGGEMA